MGIKVSVKSNIDQVLRTLNELEREVLPQAVASALNKTAAQARTEAVREIKQRFNIGTRLMSRRIKITKRAAKADLLVVVEAEGKPFPLLAFKARQVKRGVSVEVVRGQRKIIKRAFIATMKSGHKGVFARGGYAAGKFLQRTKRERRWPDRDLGITELVSLGVPQAFSDDLVQRALERKVRAKFPEILDHELRFYLRRAGVR